MLEDTHTKKQILECLYLFVQIYTKYFCQKKKKKKENALGVLCMYLFILSGVGCVVFSLSREGGLLEVEEEWRLAVTCEDVGIFGRGNMVSFGK